MGKEELEQKKTDAFGSTPLNGGAVLTADIRVSSCGRSSHSSER